MRRTAGVSRYQPQIVTIRSLFSGLPGKVAAVFTVGATVLGLAFGYIGLDVANRTLEEQRIASAWQVLSLDNRGPSGKPYALKILTSVGTAFKQLDLGCVLEPDGSCAAQPDLTSMSLTGDREISNRSPTGPAYDWTAAGFYYSSFENSQLWGSTFTDLVFRSTSFKGASGIGTTFSRSNLHSINFTTANLQMARFIDSAMGEIDFTGAALGGAIFKGTHTTGGLNFTGVRPCPTVPDVDCVDIDEPVRRAAWYYVDSPPHWHPGAAPWGIACQRTTAVLVAGFAPPGCARWTDGRGLVKVRNTGR